MAGDRWVPYERTGFEKTTCVAKGIDRAGGGGGFPQSDGPYSRRWGVQRSEPTHNWNESKFRQLTGREHAPVPPTVAIGLAKIVRKGV